MKIIHIESGLGNQMLSYCEYLATKVSNPDDNCYIETIIFEIPECNDVICQWNGYELDKVFGINAPNIKSLFSSKEWQEIIDEIRRSEFWIHNWNYPPIFVDTFRKHGLNLINCKGDFGNTSLSRKRFSWKNNYFTYNIWRYLRTWLSDKLISSYAEPNVLFNHTDESTFDGQRLSFIRKGNSIERIAQEISTAFRFPPLEGKENLNIIKKIEGSNSVSIHVRRGDMLGNNSYCYKYGYFKRAVRYIKSNIDNPVFFLFCDPDSVNWCKENGSILGLNKNDIRFYITWNIGDKSYIDMQLMAACKHNIITTSSFGWWGAYLNQNPGKITCAPDVIYNTTNSF